jgi:predicted  nucleic acid-binding Zn-ribbon protein
MTDTAPPFELLLSLQDLDTRIDQLRHQKATLPERAELAASEQALAELEREASAIQSKLDAVGRDQRRREDEVASAESKIAELNSSMYGGGVTSPRELQTMQEEIDSLRRRLSSVEDEIIELMEYAEPLQAQLVTIDGRRAELAKVEADRKALEVGIPVDVIEMYEGMRRSFNGVAVARLEHGTCGGCFLSLATAELDHIRHLPPDAIVHCEECGRLLVH